MIRINKPEPDDPAWKAWCVKAQKELEKMLENVLEKIKLGVKPQIDNDLYKAQKALLLEIFSGKCAFCETPIGPGMHGDVEHFRPKGAVTEDDGSPAKYVDEDGVEREHPGYYWLAYDWRNLLLSCQLCNQPSAGGRGKRNFFPLKKPADGSKPFRAYKPGEEKNEEPVFVHPWFEDPAKHFHFDETGTIIALTEEAKECVHRLGLDREALQDARRQAYEDARDKFNLYMGKAEGDVASVARLRRELLEWQEGKRPYSAPARVAIKKESKIAEERQRSLGIS